ncbi:WD40/YVTN/BNR-like repeat-containing protein [Parasediminibacterium sp. JCM 36343]|uniref:T9SS type A sorting domain-containing protein n=1 Tax=Parasediminibacterium sp. JCM 36343 TaxID=3374279 RepID=UPI00397DA1CA
MKKVNLFLNIVLFCLLTPVFNAKAQTYQWGNVAMGGGGFVSGLITSKYERGLMYARTDVGGAYRWDTLTSSWKPLLDWVSTSQLGFMGVESIAIDPNATNRLYMLVGTSYFNSGKTAILTSTDRGNTFTIVDVSSQFKTNGNGMGRQNGEKLQVDPNNSNVLYCGTRDSGLFRSFNMGATWSRINSLNVRSTKNGNGISFVLFDSTSKNGTSTSQTIYVGVSRKDSANLYVSKDGGSTFNPVSGAPTTYMPQRAVITKDSGNLYITYGDGAGPSGNADTSLHEPMTSGAVWKYTPSTNTWRQRTPSGFTRAFSGISLDPKNNKRIIISTINTYLSQYTDTFGNVDYGDRILYTTNGGDSWTDPIGNNGMTLNSNGVTWVNGTSMHWVGSVEFNPFDTNKVWITSGQGVFSCDNILAAKTTWTFKVSGLEETVPRDIVSIAGGPLVSVIYDYDGFKHTDITQYSTRLSPTMGTTTGVAFAGTDKNTLLRAGNFLYYSTDQAATWTKCPVAKGTGGKVAVSANGFAFLHCPNGSDTIYRTTDKGTTWTKVTNLILQNAVPVADMVDPQKFYAYDNNTGAFWKSTDRGASFTNIASIGTGGARLIRAVPDSNGHVWIAMNSGGLKYTQDAGATFTSISGITSCSAVGFGKALVGTTYPAIYIWATIGGIEGVYRSTDKGANWTRVNDDAHEYGGLGNGVFVIGSMNTYGRVFMSTAGRGIAYGQITGTTGGNEALLQLERVGEISYNATSMSLFPNPVVANSFWVSIVSDKIQTATLIITSIDGKTIATKPVVLQVGTNNIRMDNGELPKQTGIYMLSAKATSSGKTFASIQFFKK